MGSVQSSNSNNDDSLQEGILLSNLLSQETIDWQVVTRLVTEQPEQALLYCHNSVEASPLQVALRRGAHLNCIQAFLKADDEDAMDHVDSEGNTVAHACVQQQGGDCWETLQLLLAHKNMLACQTNREGKLPIHSLTSDDPKAARVLIDSYSKGLKHRDVRGRIPLHYAIDQEVVSIHVVRVLLKEADATNSTVVMVRDKGGVTPMSLLCKKLDACFEKDGGDKNSNVELYSEEGLALWELFLEMLDRSLPSYISKDDEPPLHRVVHLPGRPLSLVSYALKKFPEQARERNHLGQTPLHIAAANRQQRQREKQKTPSATLSTGIVDSDAALLISLLVNAYPPAARMTDHEGRLAIDLAAEQFSRNDSHKAMEALITAEPRALDTRDLRDKRYPFVSAAMNQDVATTYYLLRAKPHVISYFNLDRSEDNDALCERERVTPI